MQRSRTSPCRCGTATFMDLSSDPYSSAAVHVQAVGYASQTLATLAADPLASLVDTAWLGHLGTIQLAGVRCLASHLYPQCNACTSGHRFVLCGTTSGKIPDCVSHRSPLRSWARLCQSTNLERGFRSFPVPAQVGVALSIYSTVTRLLNAPLLSVTTTAVARALGHTEG